MKKLSLKKLNLGVGDLLQRDELKSVFGGYGSQCPGGGIPCSCVNGNGGVTVGCASSVEACYHFC